MQYCTSVNFGYAYPLKATASEEVFPFPCSYDQINLRAVKGHLVLITSPSAIHRRDRNSAQIPDVSLSLRTKISFANSENEAKRVMSLYCGKKNN